VVDHGRVTRSTMDRRRRGQEGTRVQQHARQSRASGHSGARELTGEGGKWRVEHGGPILALTGARVAVWWPGDDNKAAAEKILGGGGAQYLGVGEKRGGGCGENRRRHLLFIGAVRR
jgi:hypothetical protein